MSATVDVKSENAGEIPAGLRKALRDAHMSPLWESTTAHKLDVVRERPRIWRWSDTQRILKEIAQISSPKIVERRVLLLLSPNARSEYDEVTTGAMTASVQMLLPGERARPHRHSMNALRFVLQGKGAATIVDGKRCEMAPGDLVITPAWCWHEHVSDGEEPTIWVDILDVALHLFLGTDEFQPGPVRDAAEQMADEAFSVSGIIPVAHQEGRSYSPLFRYRHSDALAALQAAPTDPDGVRRVRYSNPADGQAVMSTLDCTMLELEYGKSTRPFRTTASGICVVVDGTGTSDIGGETVSWAKNDVFTLPRGTWISHTATTDNARFFVVTNRDVYRRLGLLTENYKD